MTTSQRHFSRVFCIIAILLLAFSPTWPQSAQPEGTSILQGQVRDPDGKPVPGVTVLAYHLATEQTLRSAPTNKKGDFQIENLGLGYYDVAVETPDGLFVGNAVVNIGPSGKAILNITVAAFNPGTDQVDRVFRGNDKSGDGIARVDEKLTTREFWSSPKGIAILAGTGGALLLLFATSDDTTDPVEPPASPM